MCRSNTPHWEALFTFWHRIRLISGKLFYIHVVNFLEVTDIDTETKDSTMKGWKQLKMMFEWEGWQVMQTLIDSGTLSPQGPYDAHMIPQHYPHDHLR